LVLRNWLCGLCWNGAQTRLFLLVHFIFQIAFPDAVYLVDAIEGGKELVEACKPALESDHVTKVIHDCKRDSEVPNYDTMNFL
jgi:hypothetical protein